MCLHVCVCVCVSPASAVLRKLRNVHQGLFAELPRIVQDVNQYNAVVRRPLGVLLCVCAWLCVCVCGCVCVGPCVELMPLISMPARRLCVRIHPASVPTVG